MANTVPSAFVDFVLGKIKPSENFTELPMAAKYGTKETIKPLLDDIEASILWLEDALQDIDSSVEGSEQLHAQVNDVYYWIQNLYTDGSADISKLTNEVKDIFGKKSEEIRETLLSSPELLTFDNALDLSERLTNIIDESASNNTKWVELSKDKANIALYKKMLDTLMKKVGVESNPVPDMTLFGATKYDKAMTSMINYGVATKLHHLSGKSDTYLMDYDRDHKDMGKIMIENGEALWNFNHDIWSKCKVDEHDSKLTCHYDTEVFEDIITNVNSFKDFLSLNQNLTAGWSTMTSNVNGIHKLASDIMEEASSLEYVREEVKRILEDNGVYRYDEDFKAADSTNTDWYEQYFDYDAENPGLKEIKELVEPHFKLQESYERNIEFLKEDIRDFKSTLLNEAKRHKLEGKELINVGKHWDRTLA